jgi:hypothetical protein
VPFAFLPPRAINHYFTGCAFLWYILRRTEQKAGSIVSLVFKDEKAIRRAMATPTGNTCMYLDYKPMNHHFL